MTSLPPPPQGDAERESHPGTAGIPGISERIVAGSADGIVGVDEAGIIRLCNRAAEELLGRPAPQLVGEPLGLPVMAGQSTEVELRLPAGGSRTVEMRAATVTVTGEALHIVSLRDVTKRSQAEREMSADLERQHVVVAVAAHQLHNPLAAISVLAHVLRDQHVSMRPKDRTEIIDRIIERTGRMQALVRNLLTASRIDAGDMPASTTRVRVLDVIAAELASHEDLSVDIRMSCSPSLTVAADPGELAMILANYIDNAMAYGEPPIEIQAAERESRAEIRVADHGPGVPADFVPRLFERHSRGPGSQRAAEGTGLGLWIVAAFAKANRGDAWYEPAAEGGACFCLRLPLAQETPAPGGGTAPLNR